MTAREASVPLLAPVLAVEVVATAAVVAEVAEALVMAVGNNSGGS